MGAAFSCSHAAACAANLPLGSMTLARIHPGNLWGTTDHLLWALMQMLAGKELPFPWEKPKETTLPEFGAIPVSEMDSWLNQEWTEVEGG